LQLFSGKYPHFQGRFRMASLRSEDSAVRAGSVAAVK